MFRRVLPSFSARFLSTAETQAAKTKAVKAPKIAATPDVDTADVEDSSNLVTRKILVESILEETQLKMPKTHVDLILTTFLKQINSNVMTHHKKVRFSNFGTFSLREMPARTARNPRTGEEVKVPAKQKMIFKASKTEI